MDLLGAYAWIGLVAVLLLAIPVLALLRRRETPPPAFPHEHVEEDSL